MKTTRILLIAISILLPTVSFGQDNIDSLDNKIEQRIKSINIKLKEKHQAKKKPSTRGTSDPCYSDLERLNQLVDDFVTAYSNCCNDTPSPLNLFSIYVELEGLLSNSECIWDENPEMYLILMIKLWELDYRVDEIPCARECECSGC